MASYSIKELIDKYRSFVTCNAQAVSHAESTARMFSYLAPGVSATTSELLSAAVSLISLVHDSALRSAAGLELNFKDAEKKAAVALTIIDNVEVFLEMAAYSGDRDSRRWLVVALVQVIKAVLRLVLLVKYEVGIVPSPAIPTLKRDKELFSRLRNGAQSPEEVEQLNTRTSTYKLPSTGRLIRSINEISGVSATNNFSRPNRTPAHTVLDNNQLVAESLHIMRPILHLISMYLFGQSSWKPWLIACGVDCASLCMMGDSKHLNAIEKEEMKRRTIVMLLYLLRSPFYDRYSKERLLFFLGVLAHKVPLVRVIARPLLEFLPLWQQIYFYVWAM